MTAIYSPYNAVCRIHKQTHEREFHVLIRLSEFREKCRVCGVVVVTNAKIGRRVEKMTIREWP